MAVVNEALGERLTTRVAEAVERASDAYRPGSAPAVARTLANYRLPDAAADEWWASFVPRNVTGPAGLLDDWLTLRTPAERHQQVDAAVGVARAVVAAEAPQVGQLVFNGDINAKMRQLLFEHGRALVGAALTGKNISAELDRIDDDAKTQLTAMAATPEAAKAAEVLVSDARHAAEFVANVLMLVGAGRNPAMAKDERTQMLREAAVELGPVYIKLCQSLVNQLSIIEAVSGDALPIDSVTLDALASLQDNVPPMPKGQAIEVIERSFGKPISEIFETFEEEPFAAASIGQVHRATVRDQQTSELREVAVKVQRPGLLDELEPTARIAQLISTAAAAFVVANPMMTEEQRARVIKLLEVADRTLEGFVHSFEIETDYASEAATMRRYRELTSGYPGVHVPRVFDAQSNDHVITMELVKGEKLSKVFKRFEAAQKAAERQGNTAPQRLSSGREVSDATDRAKAFVERSLGLSATSVKAAAEPRNYMAGRTDYTVELFFDSKVIPSVKVTVDELGQCRFATPVKALTDGSLDDLRGHLAAWFLSSSVQSGVLHGDMHEGNFFVMPDLSVTILDYGMMLDFGSREMWHAGRFVRAAQRRSGEGMAEQLITMVEPASQSVTDVSSLKPELAKLLQAEIDELPQNADALATVGAAYRAAAALGLAIKPLYMQAVKTSMSMGGNLAKFNELQGVPHGNIEVLNDMVPGMANNLLAKVPGVTPLRARHKESIMRRMRQQFAAPAPAMAIVAGSVGPR